jgi:hypothetical protein
VLVIIHQLVDPLIFVVALMLREQLLLEKVQLVIIPLLLEGLVIF